MLQVLTLLQCEQLVLIRIMTAAANLARSKGWTSKGLFLIFSLLCLVGFASSLIGLEKIKENHDISLQKLDTLKANFKSKMDTISEEGRKLMSSLDTMAEQQRKAMEGLPEDFPSMDTFLETAKVYMENLKAYQDKKKEELGREIGALEKELREQAELMKILDEQHEEL